MGIKKGRSLMFSLISAACFILAGLYSIITAFSTGLRSEAPYFSTIRFIAGTLVPLAFAAALLRGRKTLLFPIIAGLKLLLGIFFVINAFFSYYSPLGRLYFFVRLLGPVSLFVLALLCTLPPDRGREKITGRFFFVPAAIMLALFLADAAGCIAHGPFFKNLVPLLFLFIEIPAVFFLCLWLTGKPGEDQGETGGPRAGLRRR